MPGGGSKPGVRRGGRQKGTPNRATASVKAVASEYSIEALDILARLMRSPNTPPAARIAACREILDRAYGKPAQVEPAVPHEPETPPRQVTIRLVHTGPPALEPRNHHE
jgi:hypothetical protein